MPPKNRLRPGQKAGVFTGTGNVMPYYDRAGRLRFYLHEVICTCGNQFYIKWSLLNKQSGCKRCKNRDVKSRFFSLVKKGRYCWEWLGFVTKSGIPIFSLNGKGIPAYRISYEWHRGPLKKGQHCRRICFNKRCVNPSHISIE